jgi:hypothetical protein
LSNTIKASFDAPGSIFKGALDFEEFRHEVQPKVKQVASSALRTLGILGYAGPAKS